MVVVPSGFIPQIKNHPHLSFKASIDSDMLFNYTRFGAPPGYVISAIRAGLTPTLPQYVPVLHQLMKDRLVPVMGQYNDWTPVKIHDLVMRIALTASARVFHSAEASDSDAWLTLSGGYLVAVFDCIKAPKRWPPYLRPLVHYFLPERTAIREQFAAARALIAVSIARKAAAGGAPLASPPTMLDHLTSGKNAGLTADVDLQLAHQMTLVAVGTVTTFGTTVQCLYDLAGRPEYAALLREEVVEGLGRRAGRHGLYDKDDLLALRKMDSFMKESQRLSSPDLTTFQRAATADLTLPDGTLIPRGTKMETNTCSINADPALYENPLAFDGLRFYRQRQRPDEAHKHCFVNVGPHDMAFGFGRNACPGRFLSNNVIKILLSDFCCTTILTACLA